MNRFILSLCLALAGIASAWAIDFTPPPHTPQDVAIAPPTELPVETRRNQARQNPDSWGEWQQGFTGTADPYVAEMFRGMFGELWVEFPAPFTILTRENTTNPRLVQYKLVDIFNHADIILDYDRDTQVLSAEEQDTGIANPYYSSDPNYYYETFRFRLTGVNMFELSKAVYARLYDKPYHLLIAPEYGYALDILTFFTFDNIPDYRIGIIGTDGYHPFISSKETTKTINLRIPEGVTAYRIVDVTQDEYDNGILASNINKLCLKEPGETPFSYTTSSSPTMTVTPDEVLSYRVLIPLDADGKAAHFTATLRVSWNKPLEGEWVPAGTVTLKENLWGFGVNSDRDDLPFLDYPGENTLPSFTGEAPATQQLPIETLSTNPSVYRIRNPYGDTHPYRQYFDKPTDPADDFYLVIDATDPSQVVLRPTLAGFDRAYFGDEPFMFDNHDGVYGKMADGKISFPLESIKWGYGLPYWMQGLLKEVTLDIEFPGYVDYSMKPVGTSLDETGLTGRITDVSANVAKIEYAIFDNKLYGVDLQRFPEKLGKMIADRAEGVKVYSATPAADRTATLPIPAEELPYGFLSMVAVGIDAQGNYHTSYVVGTYTYNPTPLSQWPSAGNSTLNGWFIQGWGFSQKENTHPVDLRVSPDQEGVYCLYDAFKTEYDYLVENVSGAKEVLSYDDSRQRHIYINTSSPLYTIISDSPEAFSTPSLGIDTGLSSNETGEYTLYQFYESYGRRYTDDRGLEVINFYNAIGVRMQTIEGDFPCNIIITIDYDADKDLSRPANWDNVATVTIEENLFSSCDGSRTVATHECQLHRHPSQGYIYALIDPFSESGPVNPSWTFDNGEHHLILNLGDPDNVFFDGDSKWDSASIYTTGYTHTQFGQADMLLMVNAIRQGMFGDNITDFTPYYGTAVYDNTDDATIPSHINIDKGIYICNLASGNVDLSDDNHFRILLKKSGIDSVADDTVAGEETATIWYNLQGVRVAAPNAPGVYIKVSGDRSEKVVVR